MSRLADTLRAMGVHNNVHSPSHQTDPGAHWTLHGCKSFSGTQRTSMPLAVAWASERYGIDEWAPSPFGGKVPAYIRKAAERVAKEAKEQSNANATE